MPVKNEIEQVWLIEDNKLKCENKVVSKFNYFGTEITVLKTEANWERQEMLIKDEKENCYWKLGIAPISFNKFLNNVTNNKKDIIWKKILENTNEKAIIKYFKKSINKKEYFNMCQLKFIERHCDKEMFGKAKESRENYLKKQEQEKTERRKAIEKANSEEVEIVNYTFESKIAKIKSIIHLKGTLRMENLEFYKDNKYENGKTIQNSILYLAKEYGIDIPLSIKGFINNKLVDYNFGTGSYTYKITNGNKKCGSNIHEYMIKIINKVEEENKREVKTLREKIENMKGKNR